MSLCEHGPGHCEAAYDAESKFVATVGADSAMVLLCVLMFVKPVFHSPFTHSLAYQLSA